MNVPVESNDLTTSAVQKLSPEELVSVNGGDDFIPLGGVLVPGTGVPPLGL